MLMEMARMSVEDGLVMQLHPGLAAQPQRRPCPTRFGPDRGCDIPLATEYTRNLQPLLNAYGNDPRFRLVLFTLDESTYARELAPLAGHYPALRLGPPWWFHDSIEGMAALPPRRHRDRRLLQHRRLQRRHARVPVDPGAPRPVPARRRQLPRRPGRPPRPRARGGAGAHRRPQLRPGQGDLPAAVIAGPARRATCLSRR